MGGERGRHRLLSLSEEASNIYRRKKGKAAWICRAARFAHTHVRPLRSLHLFPILYILSLLFARLIVPTPTSTPPTHPALLKPARDADKAQQPAWGPKVALLVPPPPTPSATSLITRRVSTSAAAILQLFPTPYPLPSFLPRVVRPRCLITRDDSDGNSDDEEDDDGRLLPQ